MKLDKEALGAIAAAASSRLSAFETTGVVAPSGAVNPPRERPFSVRNQSPGRRLSPEGTTACDSAFLSCILSPTCRDCFASLQDGNVDWTDVVPSTPCNDILGFLSNIGRCENIAHNVEDNDMFCNAFDSCVDWDDTDDDDDLWMEKAEAKDGDAGAPEALNCYDLEDCEWEGIHKFFIGDGVCHDALPGCYNSKACGYDGGDCCEDTCVYPYSDETKSLGDIYGECGTEGYACADPDSNHCENFHAKMNHDFCKVGSADEDGFEKYLFDDDERDEDMDLTGDGCSSSQSAYRLIEYDSWGDGWDRTQLELTENGSNDIIYNGGLEYGSQGVVRICLTKNTPTCYHVKVLNGVWGNEVSWELRPQAAGAPVLAAGGSPSDCTFPLGGFVADCPNTCDSTRPDTSIQEPGSEYQTYKDMETCLEQKCLIQVGSCAAEESCSYCLKEETPKFCYANENFNALIDCSMCTCTEPKPLYCEMKKSNAIPEAKAADEGSTKDTHDGNGAGIPATTTQGGTYKGDYKGNQCNPKMTLMGTQALNDFADCADMDKMMTMITDFDNDNFGMLDVFEECAHTYDKEPQHGGKTAMECMKILDSIIIDEDTYTKGDLPESIAIAISTLASQLYFNAESFCGCTADVNKRTPSCQSFVHFKTLLYEAVDACQSLDAIDCAAWEEFYRPCRQNLIQMFEAVDFSNSKQCKYVEEECGGAGPFPAFRRLDCGGEIAKPAWDFHTEYSRNCMVEDSPSSSSSSTSSYVPPRNPPSASVRPAEAQKKASPPKPSPPASKPYYHSDDDIREDKPKSYVSDGKKNRHVLRNTFFAFIVVCLVGFGYIHKKRSENFDYGRFRQSRQRNYGEDMLARGGDYSGVGLEDSCSFEPPSLPPTPSTML